MSLRLTYAIVVALLLISMAASFAYGRSVGRLEAQADRHKSEAAVTAQTAQRQVQIDASASLAQAAEYDRQTRAKDISHATRTLVQSPHYLTACIDADGVRLLDQAAANANGDRITASSGNAAASADSTAQR